MASGNERARRIPGVDKETTGWNTKRGAELILPATSRGARRLPQRTPAISLREITPETAIFIQGMFYAADFGTFVSRLGLIGQHTFDLTQ
jgi:hypothetical protein